VIDIAISSGQNWQFPLRQAQHAPHAQRNRRADKAVTRLAGISFLIPTRKQQNDAANPL
jgi:hypothetical protein